MGGGGGYCKFQVTGMFKDFFWFEIFDFGIFWGRKSLGSILWGSLIYVGIFWGIQTNLLQISMARKFGMGFFCRLNLSFRHGNFWGVLIFAPIQSSLSLEIQSTPSQVYTGLLLTVICEYIYLIGGG